MTLKAIASDTIDTSKVTIPKNDPTRTLTSILNFVYLSIGIVSSVMIVIAGINYIMSGGDPEKAKKAKSTITYSIVGIIVAASAFAITTLVIGAF